MVKKKVQHPEIWAVGGGKGGTGKSFLACNIGVNLAQQGKSVVLIDADFGGANLHSFFSMPRQVKNLADFFAKRASLDELMIEGSMENISFIPGALHSFQPENIKHFQKLKFFNHIKKLEADIVLLDLGAGSHFNIIDSFLLSDKKIVVTLPQVTAMENMYFFLKNAFFRRLFQAYTENKVKYVFSNAVKNRKEYSLGNISQFVDYLQSHSEQSRKIVDSEIASYSVNIIMNQTRTAKDIALGNSTKSVCIKYFNFNAKFVGYVENDETVPLTSHKKNPYVQSYPKSRCAAKIQQITENLLHDQQMRMV